MSKAAIAVPKETGCAQFLDRPAHRAGSRERHGEQRWMALPASVFRRRCRQPNRRVPLDSAFFVR
jgi:hypothetical protein